MHLLVSAHDFYPDPGSGGTGRYVHETTRRLADRGHDVSVLTRRRGDVPFRETVAGVRVARYDLSVAGESALKIAAQLPDAVRAVRDHLDALPDPDLVSFQGTVTDPLLDLLVADEVPRSATFHSPWPTEYRIRASHEDRVSTPRQRLNVALRRRVEGSTLADCDRVFALSRFMAEKLRAVYGPVADPEAVPGGVDTECYRPDAGVYEQMEGGPTQGDVAIAADAMAAIRTLGDAVAWLPTDELTIGLQHFRDATVRRPDRYDPMDVVDVFTELLREATVFWGLTHLVAPEPKQKAMLDGVTTGRLDTKLVLTSDLVGYLSDVPKRDAWFREFVSAGGRIYRYDDPIPCNLFIIDDVVILGQATRSRVTPTRSS